MALSEVINSVRNFLASHHMFVVEDWLSGCVNFFVEETGNNNINDIQCQAKEQWLLNNLNEICPGSLPANIKTLPKTILNGRFVLQINSVVDIGTPAYQQYLKLQKVNTENIDATTKFDEKISSHRMIKLYMTDGDQEVTGIEYKPMRNLSTDITPGCKVLIKGPVECRRGILLLTESSVELLGGEVDELVSNTQARLLSLKLGLPMTQEAPQDATFSHPRNTNIPTPHAQMPPPSNERELRPTFDQTSRPVARVTGIQVNFADDDIEINMEELNAIEAQYTERSKRPIDEDIRKPEKKLKADPCTSRSTADQYPDDNDVYFEKIAPNTNTNNSDDYPDEKDFFDDEYYFREMDQYFDAKDNEFNTQQRKVQNRVSPEPFVYLKNINDLGELEKAGRVFKVKGQIMKLLSKLTVSKDGWALRCTIVDGTGSLDVAFTSDVLSDLVGLTPQEMNQIKREIAAKPEMKEKAVSALQKARNSLEALYCIIELTMLETPTITKLIPFQSCHFELLKKRLQDFL